MKNITSKIIFYDFGSFEISVDLKPYIPYYYDTRIFFYLVLLHLNSYKAPLIAILSGPHHDITEKKVCIARNVLCRKRDSFRTYNYNPLLRLPLLSSNSTMNWKNVPSYLPIRRRESTIEDMRKGEKISVKEEHLRINRRIATPCRPLFSLFPDFANPLGFAALRPISPAGARLRNRRCRCDNGADSVDS